MENIPQTLWRQTGQWGVSYSLIGTGTYTRRDGVEVPAARWRGTCQTCGAETVCWGTLSPDGKPDVKRLNLPPCRHRARPHTAPRSEP